MCGTHLRDEPGIAEDAHSVWHALPPPAGSLAHPIDRCGCVCTAEELKWRAWVDERLVRVITINIYSTGKESFQTFEYITEHGNFNWLEREGARYVGAAMMWALSGKRPAQGSWARGPMRGPDCNSSVYI